MATMKVKTKGFPDPILINTEDFDPTIHKEVTGEVAAEGLGLTPNPELRGKLPEDFPGWGALDAAGITTYAQVRKAMKDDVKITGIADATKTKIKEALAAKPEAEDEA